MTVKPLKKDVSWLRYHFLVQHLKGILQLAQLQNEIIESDLNELKDFENKDPAVQVCCIHTNNAYAPKGINTLVFCAAVLDRKTSKKVELSDESFLE